MASCSAFQTHIFSDMAISGSYCELVNASESLVFMLLDGFDSIQELFQNRTLNYSPYPN